MSARAAVLMLLFLAGCAASPPPDPAYRSEFTPLGRAAPTPLAPPGGPADWTYTVVGTPFVFGFRALVCATTLVLAGPTAGLLALDDDPWAGLRYVRGGVARNCGPPYAVPAPAAGYADHPGLGPPRSSTRYGSAAVVTP